MIDDALTLAAGLVDRGVVGALQIACRRDGAVTTASFGDCDEHSRFALASLTKPLLAAACLVACDEGVGLDQPLSDVVPESACSSTLRELLSHAGGLSADDPEARRVQAAPSSVWADVAAAYVRVVPERPARTRRTYSNAGYALAALMLERAAEMPHGEYLAAALFAPLGMARTGLGAELADPDVIAVREPGLLAHGEQLFNGERFRALGLPQSGGFGTAADYLAFLTSVAGHGPQILAPATRAELFANQCGVLEGGVGEFMEWPRCDWAVGFELRDAKTPHWTGTALPAASATHFGASGTLAFVDPVRDVQAVILANRGTYSRWMLEPAAWPGICTALVS